LFFISVGDNTFKTSIVKGVRAIEKQATWLAPALVAALTIMTLLAMAGWVRTAFGGAIPQPGLNAPGGMMGGMGIMSNVNEPSTEGRPSFEAMERMHNDPAFEGMREACSEMMGIDIEEMDRMHEQMHGGAGRGKPGQTL
jgi:hypothetical protein